VHEYFDARGVITFQTADDLAKVMESLNTGIVACAVTPTARTVVSDVSGRSYVCRGETPG
jgi:hypothetical protein